MQTARPMGVATLTLFAAIWSHQAEADDFVVMQRYLTPVQTCYGSLGPLPVTYYNMSCSSGAFVFNRDTSDLYTCLANLSYSMKVDGSIAVADDIKATCTKLPGIFSSPSKYTFYGGGVASSAGPVNPGALGNFADSIWVSENTKLNVKACFHVTLPNDHFACVTADIK